MQDYRLCFDPAVYVAPRPPSKLLRTPRIAAPRNARRFATPRHALLHAQRYLTKRSLTDLPAPRFPGCGKKIMESAVRTQLRFERGTQDDLRAGHVAAEFVEWLMG